MPKTTAIKLKAGTKYDVANLVALETGAWHDPSDAISQCPFRYSYCDWFRDGVYLGADEMGTEPVFEPDSVVKL